MIALLLAAQLAAQTPVAPPALLPPASGLRPADIVHAPGDRAACAGHPGHVEVSLAQPTALYRDGDRPAKGLRDWIAYPTPHLCLIGAAP